MRKVYPILIFTMMLLALALPANTKGIANRVIISGEGIEGEIIVSDPQALMPLSMGILENFQSGVIDPPFENPDSMPAYELKRYLRTQGENYTQFDSVRYYPDPVGGRGYVYYVGIHNGWSEYDGKWFLVQPEGESVLKHLLSQQVSPLARLLMHDSRLLRFLRSILAPEMWKWGYSFKPDEQLQATTFTVQAIIPPTATPH